jgi:hypothetical protein
MLSSYVAAMRVIHHRIHAVAAGFGQWEETIDYQKHIDEEFLAGRASPWTLFVCDGGPYAAWHPADGTDPLPIRRDHMGRILAYEPVLACLRLRYRGAGRRPESKGLTGEEGWRRTISAAVTGSRSTLNTRSQVQMAAVLMPHARRTLAQRLMGLAERRGQSFALRQTWVKNMHQDNSLCGIMALSGIGPRACAAVSFAAQEAA